MHGLLRVRGFTQDDAHIFCTPSQIEERSRGLHRFCRGSAEDLWLQRIQSRAFHLGSERPRAVTPAPTKTGTSPSARLQRRARARKASPTRPSPAKQRSTAPRSISSSSTCSGRLWQLSTVQFDFTLPARFELEYVGEDGERHQPVMVHRALFGSVERFFGVLIEHYAGAFPLWLAPVQVGLVPISERHHRVRGKSRSRTEGRGPARRDRRPQRKDERQNPRLRQPEDALHPRLRRQGRRLPAQSASAPAAKATRAPCRWPNSSPRPKRWWRASRRSCRESAQFSHEAIPSNPQALSFRPTAGSGGTCSCFSRVRLRILPQKRSLDLNAKTASKKYRSLIDLPLLDAHRTL